MLENSPLQRTTDLVATALISFVDDTGVPLNKARDYTHRLILVMAQYFADTATDGGKLHE